MISESLIGEDVWSEAPDDPEEAFLFLVLAARSKLNAILNGELQAGRFSETLWRRLYVIELNSIAEELDVGHFSALEFYIGNSEKFDNFEIDLAQVITRLRAKKRELLRADSVALSVTTKYEIRSQIERLRDVVNKSNLSEKAKERLHAKISAVEDQLEKRRASLTTFWILAGAIGAFSQASVGTLSDLPDALDAVKSIVDYVNQAKADEALNQQLFLERPPLQITHQPEDSDGQSLSD